ncbi:hypothetical protein ABBQ32_013367 [Trebouxia sp. C0010 RCD-2024]
MDCACSPEPAACAQRPALPNLVHLHPLVCRRPFRQIASGRQRRTARRTCRGFRSSVIARTSSFTVPEPYLDQEYNHVSNSAYWATRPVLVTRRTLEIGFALSQWFVQTKLSRKGDDLTTLTNQQAERLRLMLTRLGPAFVKIGQAVSSRPDVTPPDYLKELEKLQDQIPAFDSKQAMRVMEADLGFPPSRLFSTLATEPTAAASLGQVYRGILRRGGEAVAVKVQRPGVRESIALDIYILRWLAGKVKTYRKLNSDLPALLDEWATSLFKELDYVREAQNGVRFKRLYGDLEGVYVPKMYTDLTTPRVLIMEWVDGTRLRSSAQGGGGREELQMVEIGVRCSLEQMLEEGYYHSDPHPGNLFKMRTGKLAYIDFGMMGEIEGSIRRGLIQATLHLVNREFDALAEDFVVLGLLPAGSDKAEIAPALTGVFQDALANGVNNLNFGDLSSSLGQTMYKYNFRIPPYYTLLVRSLSVLEGIALSADPNYKVLGAAYPWIARRLLTEQSPELRDTLRTLLYKKGRFQFARLESLLKQAARSPGRQSWVQVGNDQVRAATGGSALELLLGPDGEYIREIIVDELAKGIDAGWRSSLDSFIGSTRSRLLRAFRVSPIGVRQGEVRSRPGGLLLEALMALPDLAGQEDQLQIDGINRLIKAMQEITSPTPTAAPTTTRAAQTGLQTVANTDSSGRLISYAGNTSAVARTGNARAVASTGNIGGAAQTGNMQTAAMRSGTPASTSNTGTAPVTAAPSIHRSSSSMDRSQAVQGSNLVEAIQQTVQMLQWFVQEASQLPPAARLEALRIPLSLGNKVSSRLLARATRALLAPGAGPISNANSRRRDPDTFATTGSAQSASSTTGLRDSVSAIAVRTGRGNLTDNPTALGGSSQMRPGELELESEEDPFIKDTEDLVRSMQTSSPSWNAENPNIAAPADTVATNYSQGSVAQVPLTPSNGFEYQAQDGSTDKAYVREESETSKSGSLSRDGESDMVVFDRGEAGPETSQGSRARTDGEVDMVVFDKREASSETSKGGKMSRDGAIDMVAFDRGQGRASIESSVSSNGSTRP